MICRIGLKPISKPAFEHYESSALIKLLGRGISPLLPFSRAQFHQNAPRKSTRMSISGMQPKLSLARNTTSKELELTNLGGEWILKPSPLEYPNAAENEHCAMLSGVLFGIPMAQCGLLEFEYGELTYVTRRFDRMDGLKLPQEDLLQCMGKTSDRKYEGSYESAGIALREICGGRMSVIRDYFIRILHSFVIGNDDLHLKNLSVTRSPDHPGPGYEKLTPHYDVLFARAFENVPMFNEMALDLLQEEAEEGVTEHTRINGFYTGPDFLTLGTRLGLPTKTSRKLVEFAIARLPEIEDLVSRSYMPKVMKKRAITLCRDRIKQLGIGLA